jgi:hypothetical protein
MSSPKPSRREDEFHFMDSRLLLQALDAARFEMTA